MHVAAIAALMLAGCAAPRIIDQPHAKSQPHLNTEVALMSDGYRLPLQRWSGSETPSTLLLGLHGFNDYSQAFAPLAEDLAARGVTTYAVDQRGFGAADQAGRWHGGQRLVDDLHTLIALLRQRHPQARLLLAGESMGGAITMVAAAQAPLDIDGLILIAPAVWSRDTMPWYQRLALEAAARTVPWLKLTGEGIRLSPTDSADLLDAMSADPLVIKATRVDALWGITDLMDAARDAGTKLARPALPPYPVLLLYGEHDEIIPKHAFCRLLGALPAEWDGLRFVLYRNGWHMLPRDQQGARVRADIAAWMSDPRAPLPSGEEASLQGERVKGFCGS